MDVAQETVWGLPTPSVDVSDSAKKWNGAVSWNGTVFFAPQEARALLVLAPSSGHMHLVPIQVRAQTQWGSAVLLGPVLHAVPYVGDLMLKCDLPTEVCETIDTVGVTQNGR